jgi:hypothetical protein
MDRSESIRRSACPRAAPHVGLAVALRVDHDHSHAVLDCPYSDPGLGHGLARAGRADHQRVRASARATELNRHVAAVIVTTDDQSLTAKPTVRAQRPITTCNSPDESAQRVQRPISPSGDLGQVGACIDVFAVPTTPAQAGAERSDPQRQRPAAQQRPGEHVKRQATGGPAPVEMPAARRARRDRPDHETERNMSGRAHQPVRELLQWQQGIDTRFARERIGPRFGGLFR